MAESDRHKHPAGRVERRAEMRIRHSFKKTDVSWVPLDDFCCRLAALVYVHALQQVEDESGACSDRASQPESLTAARTASMLRSYRALLGNAITRRAKQRSAC